MREQSHPADSPRRLVVAAAAPTFDAATHRPRVRIGERLAASIARVDALDALLVTAVILGVLARARHVLLRSGPLNDGGMFATMSADIQRTGYALPEYTTYNVAEIPFAYPPAALYLAAVVEDLTPLSMVDVYWLLPLLVSLVAMAGFYALARTVLEGRIGPIVALMAFALTPRAFEWLIMGGGLTRGLGMAAALIALATFRRSLERRDAHLVAVAGALAALTLMSHMEAAVFLAAGVALSVAERRSRWSVGAWGAAAAIGIALAAPWWGAVVARHGFEPFLASADHGGTLFSEANVPLWLWQTLIDPVATGEAFFAFTGAAGFFGALLALTRGRWMLPAWWAALILVHMRGVATLAVVPVALLAADFVVHAAAPAAREAIRRAPSPTAGHWRVGLVAAGVVAIMYYGAVEPNRAEARFLRTLSDGDLQAMQWVAARTAEDARFVIVPRREWFADREGEWFPWYAGRESVLTPQGTEWVPGEFSRRAGWHNYLRRCGDRDADCLDPVLDLTDFTHVYLPAGCCRALRESLREDPRYVLRYLGSAAIFQRVEMPPAYPPEMFPSVSGLDAARPH